MKIKIDINDFLQAVGKPELLDKIVIGNEATDPKELSEQVQTILTSLRR